MKVLKKEIERIINQRDIAAAVYFVMKSANDNDPCIKKTDIDPEAQTNLLQLFVDGITQEVLENEFTLIKLSLSDERKDVIYEYDYKYTKKLALMKRSLVGDEIEEFSFKEDKASEIDGVIIVIGNSDGKLILYKKYYSINVLKRDSFAFVKGASNRLVQLESDVLKISPSFDFFKVNETLYVKNVSVLESNFGFKKTLMKKANKNLTAIEKQGILTNITQLEEGIAKDVSFCRKVAKCAKDSPVLEMSNSSVIEFTQTYPKLKGQFKYSDDNTQINLTSKKARNLFVSLLNDNYLQSQLTQTYYESHAKDPIGAK
jgi:hypothetical protein